MFKCVHFIGAALLLLLTACNQPHSVLDKTEWLNTEHGLRLSIEGGGEAVMTNVAQGLDPVRLTYGPDPEIPGSFLFQTGREGEKVDIMHAELPGYAPPAEGEKIERPETMDKLVGYVSGRKVDFVPDTAESREAFERQVAFAKAQAKKLGISEAPRDASRYVDMVERFGPNWATYYVLAHSTADRSDEEKLGLFSSRWNSTRDSFEREGMKAEELAAIETVLKEVSAIEYIALSLDIGGSNPWAGLDTMGGGYDFERKGFTLVGPACDSSMAYSNGNGVSYAVSETHGAALCFLPVEDQAIAQQIERVRTATGAINAVRGKALYKLGPVEGNRIELLPVGMNVEVGDFFLNKSREPLLSTVVWGEERKQG